MTERRGTTPLTQLVDGPPVRKYRRDGPGWHEEENTLVGWIAAPPDCRQALHDLGIEMQWAEYDRDSERWERCLFSEEVADMLEGLSSEGEFPYAFEAGPSEGEVRWLQAQVLGATERPTLTRDLYLIPATAESLDALATGAVPRKTRGAPRGQHDPSTPSPDQPSIPGRDFWIRLGRRLHAEAAESPEIMDRELPDLWEALGRWPKVRALLWEALQLEKKQT